MAQLKDWLVTYHVVHAIGSGLFPEDGRAHPYSAKVKARNWEDAQAAADAFGATVDGELIEEIAADDDAGEEWKSGGSDAPV